MCKRVFYENTQCNFNNFSLIIVQWLNKLSYDHDRILQDVRNKFVIYLPSMCVLPNFV